MKKLIVFLLILAMTTGVFGAITNTLTGHRPTAYWWTSATSPQDRAMLWAIEVETLLGATAGTTTASKTLIVNSARQLDQIRLLPTDTEPSSPTEGTIYADASENTWKVYNGSAWVALTPTTFTGGNITSDITLNADGVDILPTTTTAHTWSIQAYDVDGTAYLDVVRWTNANTPAIVLGHANASFALASTGVDISTAGAITNVSTLTTSSDVTVGGNLAVTGTQYLPSITAASAGNVALNLNAAGNAAVNIASISTGNVAIGTGLTVAGNTTLGDAATDTIGITGIINTDTTLDDGAGASPSLILQDATNETATFSKVDAGFLTITTVAGDGVSVRTGNLTVGNGTPTVAQDGEDAYVEGTFEVDGASQFDAASTFNADVAINDQILATLATNDEEVLVTATATDYAADSAIVTVLGAAQTNSTYLLRLRQTPNADAQNLFLVCEDNAADDKLAVGDGGTTLWTLDAASTVRVDAETTGSTNTTGAVLVNMGSATNNGKGVVVDVTSTIAIGEITDALYINLDDDTAAAGSIRGIYIASDDSTGSSVLYGLVTANSLDSHIYSTLGAANTWATVDAATTDSTLATGVLDIDFDTVTNNAEAVNIKATQITGGAGVNAAAVELELDSDSGNAGDILYGLIINATDTTATGKVKGLYVKGAGIDAGLQLDTGYLRVGTGSTAGQSIGDDDAFFEGLIEVDAGIYSDGPITGDGGDALGGFLKTVTADTDGKTLTVAESGTVQTNAGAAGAAAWTLPTAVAGYEYVFVVMAAFELRVTPAAGDVVYINGVGASAAEYWAADAVGESLHLIAVDATNWIGVSHIGTWTQQTP